MKNMGNKIIGICLLDEDDNVLKTEKIEVKWKEDDVGYLSHLHSLKTEDAISNIVYLNIKNNLTIEVIKKLLENNYD